MGRGIRARGEPRLALTCGAFLLLATTHAQLALAEDLAPGTASAPSIVEVHGDARTHPSDEPTFAASVISRDRLEGAGVRASDVLRVQPGVTVVETGGYGALSTASIRGATSAQTPVYLAGARLNDDVGGGADLSLVPLWMVHHVDIYRSGAPVRADQLGIGGAIFFEPRTPKQPAVEAGGTVGSFGARGLWGDAEIGNDKGAMLVGARYETATNDFAYSNDGGTRFDASDDRGVVRKNAAIELVDLWNLGSLDLGRGARARWVVNRVARSQGMPGFSIYSTERAHLDQQRTLVSAELTTPCGADDACTVRTHSAITLTGATYNDPLREVALGTTHLDLIASRMEDGATIDWRPAEAWTLTASLHGASEHLSLDAAEMPAMRARRIFSRGAGGARWQISRVLMVHALVSAECHATSLLGRSPWLLAGDARVGEHAGALCTNVLPSARAGMEYLVAPPISLLWNVGSYGRAPTLSELFGISGDRPGQCAA